MCLLNGEVGGALESSVDFGAIEEENEDGVWEIRKIPVREIIRNAVHVYAREPYHNIVINDLEDFGLELLEYRYDIPMYLYRRAESVSDDGTIIPASYVFDNVLLNGSKKCLVEEDGVWVETTLDKLSADHLDMLVDTLVGTKNPSIVKIDETDVYVAKVEYGQTAGYRLTDLIYPGDLIANIGESVVSVLDKIKNMLAEFEYFYDVDGRFIFQKKKSFINTIWTPTMAADNEEGGTDYYVDAFVNSSSWSYTFNEGELITAFNNAPNLLNMRNDFSIWGVRKGITGADIPVHMRYAIDSKPVYYKTFDDVVYISDESLLENGYILTDWREIIFQMAKDYYKHNLEDDFEL
jgi:hypothetical protein